MSEKKKLYIKLSVVAVVIIFLILFIGGHELKALSFLLITSGFLGLITKTDPFVHISKNPFIKTRISYDEDSIGGPVKNVFLVILGLLCFFI